MKYTIKDLQAEFPTEDACLEYIFNSKYGKSHTCPKCSKTGFHRVKGRKCYACAWCSYQIHPLANTIFHKSDTKLTDWFFAIYKFSNSKNGVSAKELQRDLGVTYKTAWRMAKQIRSLMGDDNNPLSGTVETDGTFIGGKRRMKVKMENKTAILGMVERKGRVKSQVVPNETRYTVHPILRKNITIGSNLMSDEHVAYQKLAGYNHKFVKHGVKEYVKGDVHTNTIEGFWSQIKRSIDGTYHAVSPKHLQSYCDEFSYRYNRRTSELPLFRHLLGEIYG